MAWHLLSDKPLSLQSLLTHLCVTQPRWLLGLFIYDRSSEGERKLTSNNVRFRYNMTLQCIAIANTKHAFKSLHTPCTSYSHGYRMFCNLEKHRPNFSITWALVRYGKLRVAHTLEMAGLFYPPPRFSDPDMHQGTCVMHVPWCMPGLLNSGFLRNRWRENVLGIPGACTTRNFMYLVRGLWIAVMEISFLTHYKVNNGLREVDIQWCTSSLLNIYLAPICTSNWPRWPHNADALHSCDVTIPSKNRRSLATMATWTIIFCFHWLHVGSSNNL